MIRRVLLIGRGPLPGPTVRQTGFPQLRLATFRDALHAAGHEVVTVALRPWGASWAGSDAIDEDAIDEDVPGWLDAVRSAGRDCEIVVSAGPYRPAEVACGVAGDRPVWADVPGDPLAELQSWCQATGRDAPGERLGAALSALLPVLARADRISVVSGPQRLAMLGQLGLAGRLASADPGVPGLVHVVPIAADIPSTRPALDGAEPRPHVLLSGGFNTWFDQDTVADGLLAALREEPSLRVVVTGGPLDGFYEEGWQAFAERMAGDPRVDLCGWLPASELSRRVTGAAAGVFMDRKGLEPELGSRTRVVHWLAHGVPAIGTARTELAQELVTAGLLDPVTDADSLCAAVVAAVRVRREVRDERANLARAWVASEASVARTCAPLVAWAAHPARVAAGSPTALIDENARLRRELAEVHGSLTWRMLNRLRRGPR